MAHGILDKQLPNSLLGLKGAQPPAHPSSNPLSQLHAQGTSPTAMDPQHSKFDLDGADQPKYLDNPPE